MILIAEILLFAAGLYVAISGKMPSWIAGKGYKAEGGNVRLIGLLMLSPLPAAFCVGVVLGLLSPDNITYASIIEIVLVLGIAILSAFMIRNVRQPETPSAPPQIKQ
jgi:hypothetical protein